MSWIVKFHDDFKAEFDQFAQEVKDELLAEAAFVQQFGPATSGLTWTNFTARTTQT